MEGLMGYRHSNIPQKSLKINLLYNYLHMKFLFYFGFVLMIQLNTFGQQTYKLGENDLFDYQTNYVAKGEIFITQDNRLPKLVQKHIAYNSSNRGMQGYRIQIFFGSGADARTKAQAQMKKFKQKYNETQAYLVYESPFFKVRVGDFRTKLEAMGFKNEIIGDFPSTWLVEDQIIVSD